jgi:translation initiation factor 2B subunit (eIF-2B alpha/beta/delta family)
VQRHPFTGALWWLCANVTTSAEPFEAVWELADEIRSDRTGAELGAELPDDATVVTIGAPSSIGDGLIRRGDVRVLVLDVDHAATQFLRRLERHDVDCDPIEAGAAGPATRVADVVLIEALAVDVDRVVVPMGSSTIAAAARTWDTPVWLVAGVGRRLPTPMLDAMVAKYDELIDATGAREPGDAYNPWDLDIEILPTTLITDVVGPHGRMPMGPHATAAECSMAYELLKASPM